MPTELPKEPLRTLIASLTGIPISRVYWRGEPEKMTGPIGGKAGKITLQLTALAEGDGYEVRRALSGSDLTERGGLTDIATISIRADNFLRYGEAFDLLRKLRLQLQQRDVKATLRASEMAYVDAPSVTRLDYVEDNREVSAANLDMRVAHVATLEPTPIDWIERVTSKDAEDATSDTVDLDFTPVP